MDEEKTNDQAVEHRERSEPRPADFPPVQDKSRGASPRPIMSLGNINVRLSIRLGASGMLVKDVLQLRNGSVVELDKLAGEQVDLYINDVFFAKGEVLVIGDTLGIRITEIAGQEEFEEEDD